MNDDLSRTEYVLACLQDVLNAIDDMQGCFANYPNRYDVFEKDILYCALVERKVEIMGEAINRIRKVDPELEIPNGRQIVATRNRIIHSYDNVRPDFLWSLVVRHIPVLRKDIENLIAEYELRFNSGIRDSQPTSQL